MEKCPSVIKLFFIHIYFHCFDASPGYQPLEAFCLWAVHETRAYAHVRDRNTKCLLTRYPTNRSREFHQIHDFGAVGDEDELIRF